MARKTTRKLLVFVTPMVSGQTSSFSHMFIFNKPNDNKLISKPNTDYSPSDGIAVSLLVAPSGDGHVQLLVDKRHGTASRVDG